MLRKSQTLVYLFVKASNGVVLATEKKHKSILYEDHSTYKIEKITDRIGMVYSGMGPDYRLLVRRARKMAQVSMGGMFKNVRLIQFRTFSA